MTLSEKQVEADRIWNNEDVNLLVDSVAGSGKTTLILNLVKDLDGKVLMLAFNKSIQTNLEEKTSGNNNLKAMTLHGLGFMAIKKEIGNHIRVNKGKNFIIWKKLRNLIPSYFKSLSWKRQVELSSFFLDLNDTSRMFITESMQEAKTFMRAMGKPTLAIADKVVQARTEEELRELQKEDSLLTQPRDATTRDYYKIDEKILWDLFLEMRNSITTEIDFLDMIYIPVVMDLDIPMKPDYLTIDEAQDLNHCQHLLIDKIIAQPQLKKWLAVGDYRQSIYSFAGALSDSFDRFRTKDNVKEVDLDICYRCSVDIIEKSNTVYDVMRGFRTDKGIVAYHTEYKDVVFEPDSLVICRNQAPLLSLFFYLGNKKIPSYLKGEDFVSGIINHLRPFRSKKLIHYYSELQAEVNSLKRETSQQKRIQYYLLKDKLEILKVIMDNMHVSFDYIKDVIPKLELLFVRKRNAVCLCTIHKAKGSESNTVYWLYPELIPSKYATSPDQLIQEKNLKYVAITRAIEKLIIINKKQDGEY